MSCRQKSSFHAKHLTVISLTGKGKTRAARGARTTTTTWASKVVGRMVDLYTILISATADELSRICNTIRTQWSGATVIKMFGRVISSSKKFELYYYF